METSGGLGVSIMNSTGNNADFFFIRGKDDYLRGNYQNCIRDLVYAHEIYNSMGQNLQAAETLFMLANAYYQIQQYTQSRQMFSQAYSRYKETNKQEKVAECSFYLGELYRAEGNFLKGKQFLAEAIDIYTKLKDLERLADTWRELGNIAQVSLSEVSDHPSHTENAYRTAINLYKKIKNQQKKAETEFDLGQVLVSSSKFDEALKYLTESLAYYAKNKDYDNVIAVSIMVGRAYFQLGKKPKAREFLYRAVEQMRKADINKQMRI